MRTREQPPEKVIAWLRTPEGEEWSSERMGSTLACHSGNSGLFASVLPDGSKGSLVTWPDPGAFDIGLSDECGCGCDG